MRIRTGLACLLALAAVSMALPATGEAKLTKVKFTRLGNIPGTGGVVSAFSPTSDGRLHLIFPSSTSGAQGLTSRSSNLSGLFTKPTPALSAAWGVSAPGLLTLPGGTLEAFFGAAAPAAPHPDGTWAISSADGGATWSAPSLVSNGTPLESQAYGAAVTAQMSGSTPVLTLNVSGGLVVQYGLGSGAPAQRVDTPTDGSPVSVDSAVDAANGQVVAAWDSLTTGTGGLYMQTVAPSLGTPQKLPGQSRPVVTIAGRDEGAGVFAAYTSDDEHVRLLRYGGGTVAVGSVASVTPAALGVATGFDGRIWVMWGSDSGHLAITRSNKAVTRFEPIQQVHAKLATLDRLYGDGRRQPLDLLVDELPDNGGSGLYQAKILPELSAAVAVKAVKNKQHQVVAHQLTVTVTDAGDAVKGATVSVKQASKKTNIHGVAKFTVKQPPGATPEVTVKDSGYRTLSKQVKLG